MQNPGGRVDFSALGRELGLDPASITLNGLLIKKTGLESKNSWEQLEQLFKDNGISDGTQADPVIVDGEVSTDSISFKEWLEQRLPPLNLWTCSVSSSRAREDIYTSTSTVVWDLLLDLEKYLADAGAADSRHRPIDIEEAVRSKRLKSESDCRYLYEMLVTLVGLVVLDNIFNVFTGALSFTRLQQPTSGRGPNSSNADANTTVQLVARNSGARVDIVLNCSDRDFAVVEMRRHSSFRITTDNDPPNLVEAQEQKDSSFYDGQGFPVLAQSIMQLFKYLLICGIGYGITSLVDLSYFVNRNMDNFPRCTLGGSEICSDIFLYSQNDNK